MNSIGSVVVASLAALVLSAPAIASHGKHSPRIHVGVDLGRIGFGFSNYHRVPAPRAYCPPTRVWVPGHYETRCETIRRPGCYKDVWVAPVYERRTDHCGTVGEVLVRSGYFKRVWVDGGHETREVRVWVPGRYE